MSIESINHNARSIVEAYEIYEKLLSEKEPNKEKIGKIKQYMIKISEMMKKSVEGLKQNVG